MLREPSKCGSLSKAMKFSANYEKEKQRILKDNDYLRSQI